MDNNTVDNYFVFKVKEGKQERYEQILAEQLAITKEESETLVYEIFRSENGLYYQHERYSSEAHCIAHMQNTKKQLQEWFQLTEIIQLVVTGKLSREFIEENKVENYLPYAKAK